MPDTHYIHDGSFLFEDVGDPDFESLDNPLVEPDFTRSSTEIKLWEPELNSNQANADEQKQDSEYDEFKDPSNVEEELSRGKYCQWSCRYES